MSDRGYDREIAERVESCGWRVESDGSVAGLPLLKVVASRSGDLPTIYINGGTHGDEPAGSEAALQFLEASAPKWVDRFRFEVIPCLNPTGFVAGTRENAAGIDLNWAYPREDLPEIAMLRRFIAGRRFEAVIDLHEDWESPGYYLYEQYRGREPAGPKVTERVAASCPINTSEIIEEEAAKAGVIFPNLEAEKRRRGDGVPIVLFRERYTDHLITSETPTELPLDVRVAAHLTALDVILESHAES